MLWHCNQHNILKLKLPLKYIQLKIGDYIGFDKLINGVKLFGEDYSISGWYTGNTFRNGQQILPVWMVTSTAKTLTHIDVEMIQMHNCSKDLISLNYPPVIVSDGFNLQLVSQIQNDIIGHNIVLTTETDGDWFTGMMTINASDLNNDALSYRFFIEGDWDDFIELSQGIVNSPNVLQMVGLYQDLQIQFPLSPEPPFPYTVNVADFQLGGEFSETGWLLGWLESESYPDGDFIQFPTGMIQAVAYDGYQMSNISYMPSFRVYKNNFPDNVPATVTVEYNAGWNLVSVPLDVTDANYLTLFPDAVPSSLYGFDGTYSPESNMEVGKGYMLNFNNSGTVEVEGTVAPQYDIALMSGWNLIGGIGNTDINFFSTVIDPNEILVTGSLYEFDGTYLAVTQLQPGRGYWVRASNSGIITIPVNNG